MSAGNKAAKVAEVLFAAVMDAIDGSARHHDLVLLSLQTMIAKERNKILAYVARAEARKSRPGKVRRGDEQ